MSTQTKKLKMLNKERVGWITYDWANSAYVLCVITTLGFPYFNALFLSAAKKAGGVMVGPSQGMDVLGMTLTSEATWSYMIAAAGLIVAFSSPLLGAIADAKGNKKKFLQFYWLVGVIATAGISIGLSWWAVGLLILLSNIGFEGGNVFYNAFLPEIAPEPHDQDLISSWGFAAGYLGGVLVLIASSQLFIPPNGEITHAFLLVAVWWFLFGLVTFSLIKERPSKKKRTKGGSVVGNAFSEIVSTVRNISKYPQAAMFLLAFLLYNDGIVTLIANATPFAMQNIYQDASLTEKISQGQLISAIVLVQIIAVPGAMLWGWLSVRWGEKMTIYLTLVVYSIVVFIGQFANLVPQFFIMAGLIGVVLGGSQAISRSLFASLTPEDKHAEFFAFFALSSKFSAFLGPMTYGVLLQITGDTRLSLISLVVFFVAGGLFLSRVNVAEGRAQASLTH